MTQIDLAVSTYLANALWLGVLIALAAWCAVKILESASAKGHYLIWAAALILSLIVPTLALRSSESRQVVTVSLITAGSEPAAPAPSNVPWLTGAYALVVLFELSKVAVAWRRSHNLKKSPYRKAPHTWQAACDSSAEYFGVRQVELGVSEFATVPLTVGFRKPLILIPEGFDEALVEGTVTHEMAHIARHDYAWNIVLRIVSAPLAILPGVLFAKRQLERAREMACDEMAAEAASDHRSYASQLVGAAELLQGRRPAEAGLGVLDGNILEERVKRIMRGGVRATQGGAIALALAVTALIAYGAASKTPVTLPSQAAISGVVKDASGAVVPNAKVIMRSASGLNRTLATNAVGEFRFGALQPGDYSLEVQQRGFRLLRSRPFRVAAGTEWNMTASLEIGRIRETINVIGN